MKEQKTSKFIEKLYEIIENKQLTQIMWHPSGNSFIVTDKIGFILNILPLISKTKEYSAFVRLLNHYGFSKKCNLSIECEEYFHPNFIRGEVDNLHFISRVKNNQITVNNDIVSFQQENKIIKHNMEYLNSVNCQLQEELKYVKEKLIDQEKTLNGLIDVFSKVFNVGLQSSKHPQLLENLKNDRKISMILKKEDLDFDLDKTYNLEEDKRKNLYFNRKNETKKNKEKNSNEDQNDINLDDFF